MTGQGPATLAEALEAAAMDLEGAERKTTASGAEWSIGGIVFAAVDGGLQAEFRLAPEVAAAAVRTPDTVPSARGGDWVTFHPTTLDRHAVDRATAWLASARRRAGGAG